MGLSTSARLIILSFYLGTAFLATQAKAADVPQSFTLDGKLFSDATATIALQDSSIAFTVQIVDEAKVCVLYEEAQTLNTVASKGYFTMQVGTEVGSPLRTAGDSANSMSHVFQNISTINGKLLSNGAPCTVPPTAAKRRFVRIKILPSTMGGVARLLSPDLSIDSVPNAIIAERAETLQGLRSTDVLRVNTTGTNQLSQTNLESLFTSMTRFNSLTSIVDGTSTSYMRSNSASGAQLPVTVGAPTGPAPGSIWYDSADSKMKYQTSVGPVVVGSGSGTVTSVGLTAPSELSVAGAPITSSGDIAISWATQTANKVFASPDGATGTPAFRALVAGDIPSLPWTKITSLLPTTLLGYGITDAVRNAGGTPSFESGFNAAKGTATTAGRIWISIDTKEIYRDNGTTWDLIGSAASGGTSSGAIGHLQYSDGSGGFSSDTNQLFWDASNNRLGIGTSTPAAQIDADFSGHFFRVNQAAVFQHIGDGYNSGSAPYFLDNGDVTNGQGQGLLIWAGQGASDYPLHVKSNGGASSLLSVRGDGNVGIGTTTPGQALDVQSSSGVEQARFSGYSVVGNTFSNNSGSVLVGATNIGGRLDYNSATTTLSLDNSYNNASAATEFRMRTSGTPVTAMAILGSGNVGIGTSTPLYKLDVKGNPGVSPGFWELIGANRSSGSNRGVALGYIADGTSDTTGAIRPMGTTSDLAIYTRASSINNEVMRLTATGNVGIGTTSPNTILDIAGAQTFREIAAPAVAPVDQGRIYFDSTANKFKVSENNGAYVDLVSGGGASSGTTGHIQYSNGSGGFASDTSNLFWDATNNRLGINTNSPAHSVDVVGGVNTDTAYYVGGVSYLSSVETALNNGGPIKFRNTNSTAGSSTEVIGGASATSFLKLQSTSANGTTDSIRFAVDNNGGTEAMRIINNGNVGIGTTTPSANLEVSGVNGGGKDMFAVTTSGNPVFVVDQWQRVGIKTDPGGSTLNVLNNDSLANAANFVSSDLVDASGVSITTYSNSTSNYGLEVLGNAGARTDFYVRADGNVGIGTTAPDAKLDVNGAVAVSASIEGASAYINSGASYSIPDSTVNIRRLTLDSNTTLTLPTFTTPAAKVWTLTVMVKQDATGNRTLAWAASGGASILWDQSATAPAPSAGANKVTIYQFTKASDEATWYGSMVWKQN